jgi:hypothetical protein
MSPVIPVELMTGAIQMVCYFFTMLAAMVGFILVRNG